METILLFVLCQLSVVLKKMKIQHKIHQIDNWIYLIGLIKRINFNPVSHMHTHTPSHIYTIDSQMERVAMKFILKSNEPLGCKIFNC